MHRLFVAIHPPQAAVDLLVDTMEGFPALRWENPEQIHLTLRFIGEVERPVAEDVAVALGAVSSPAFALRIAGVGRFDHRACGALWAAVEPRAPVAALAAKIDRACMAAGLPSERRAFHPHLTIARWGPAGRASVESFLERHAGLRSTDFVVDRFTLFESHLGRDGAFHEPIAAYPLGAVDPSGRTPI